VPFFGGLAGAIPPGYPVGDSDVISLPNQLAPLCAILLQAIRESQSGSPQHREAARQWLSSELCGVYCDWLQLDYAAVRQAVAQREHPA
jgi:hypothetical protein